MSDMSDAKPGDLYIDQNEKLWRVVGRWGEPTVILEQIEKQIGIRMHGGISGRMWDGFQRIHRPKTLDGIPHYESSDKPLEER